MSNTSPYLGLLLPVGTDNFNRLTHRGNLEAIDLAVGQMQGDISDNADNVTLLQASMVTAQADISDIKNGNIIIPKHVPFYVPGDTVLIESLAEVHYSSTISKRFRTPFPGRFRITGEAHGSSESYNLTVRVLSAEVEYTQTDVIQQVVCSSSFQTTSTTYVSFSLDMTIANAHGSVMAVVASTAGSQTASLRNVRVKGVPGAVDTITEIT
jgi:hypothetical protein